MSDSEAYIFPPSSFSAVLHCHAEANPEARLELFPVFATRCSSSVKDSIRRKYAIVRSSEEWKGSRISASLGRMYLVQNVPFAAGYIDSGVRSVRKPVSPSAIRRV